MNPTVSLVEAQAVWNASAFKAAPVSWCILDGQPHVLSEKTTFHFPYWHPEADPDVVQGFSSPQAEREREGLSIDPTPVAVVFRKDKGKNGEVFALMPELPSDLHGRYCTSYQHVGQHAGADYHLCVSKSHPASPDEYQDLAVELGRRGYNVIVTERATAQMHEKRRKDARDLAQDKPYCLPLKECLDEAAALPLPSTASEQISGNGSRIKR